MTMLALLLLLLTICTGLVTRNHNKPIVFSNIIHPNCKECKYYIDPESTEKFGRCELFYDMIDVNGRKKRRNKEVPVVRSWDCVDGLYYVEKEKEEKDNSGYGNPFYTTEFACKNKNNEEDDTMAYAVL